MSDEEEKGCISYTAEENFSQRDFYRKRSAFKLSPYKAFFFLIEKKGVKILLLSLIRENSLICKKLINSQKINGKVLSF